MRSKTAIRFSLIVLLLALGWAAVFTPAGMAAARRTPAAYATTITVDSGKDLDNSDSKTCLTATPCTLRRAVIQARNSAKPVLIEFAIPEDAAEGYDSSLDIWRIQFLYTSSTSLATLRYLNGEITIDGSTQPGGRAAGPKIILIGPGTGQNDGLKLGETALQNANAIRNLGFQNFSDAIIVNSDLNIIEDNWFGLSDDGTQPALRNDEPEDGTGSSGVAISDGSDQNVIQNNVFLGFDGVAAAIRGEANLFAGNYVGTRFDGRVTEKQTAASLLCTTVDWLGGGGLSLDGPDHIIENNIFAGLRQEIFAISTQPDAIWVQSTCDGCIIQNNKIGLDSKNNKIGVCGIGIDITNGEEVSVLDNQFANPYHSALFLNGSAYDANTLSGNLIQKTTPWLAPDDQLKADDAMLRFTGLPDPFEFFKPAKVTSIEGLTVTGTAGDDSPCPNCTIEIFLDDNDGITETLQSLAVVTANARGNWTATLPAELAEGQGLRTTSTSTQYNVIPGMNAGTTAGLSEIYLPVIEFQVYIPIFLDK